jgi:ribosome-associated protein
MRLQKLQRVIVDALEDVKGQDIKVYNTVGLSDMFDRVVLASGTSNRQTRALASNVAEKVKAAGGRVVSVEGTESGEWVLVDLGDIVVHIMQPAIRAYYELEEMWGSRPVRVKLASAQPDGSRAGAQGRGAADTRRAAARGTASAAAPAPKRGAAATPSARKSAAPRRPAAGATKARKPARGGSARKKSARKPAR